MANQPEEAVYDEGVYQIEITDPVQGALGGLDNKPLLNLANRTAWLKQHVDALESGSNIPVTYAPINSPSFTGSPAAPTPPVGDDTTKIPTTAFVQTAVGGMVTVDVSGNSNVTLTAAKWGASTIILIGAQTGNLNVVFPTRGDRWLVVNATTGTGTITCKTAAGSGVQVVRGMSAPIFCDAVNAYFERTDFTNVALTGVPTAPTAPDATDTDQIASTKYVQNTYRTFAPIDSPTFTGVPAGPTPAAGDKSTKFATTAFVQDTAPPVGGIIMYSGLIADIPLPWRLCDGTNGTPDLRDKFIVGARSDHDGTAKTNITGALTKSGGSVSGVTAGGGEHNHAGFTGSHVLTLNEMPSHRHLQYSSVTATSSNSLGLAAGNAPAFAATLGFDNNGYFTVSRSDAGEPTIGRTSPSGGADAHNHSIAAAGTHTHTIPSVLPPYVALAFIMRTA
ncbi:hypothetical protein [Parvibaculum sp.]|uniref:hypothetical protein n=1 Tax=Parvibaculum sp. TaxID=2024848 RepID=UPI002736FA55|nr:hypothetical protein [Parvibaculum sp.]MDP3327219.1 hypothetical protein [Parvibaculum sp.]